MVMASLSVNIAKNRKMPSALGVASANKRGLRSVFPMSDLQARGTGNELTSITTSHSLTGVPELANLHGAKG